MGFFILGRLPFYFLSRETLYKIGLSLRLIPLLDHVDMVEVDVGGKGFLHKEKRRNDAPFLKLYLEALQAIFSGEAGL